MTDKHKNSKDVTPNVYFSINDSLLVHEMFYNDGNQNDLAIAIENGTNQMWQVAWNNDVGHGSFNSKKYSSTLKAIDPYSAVPVDSTNYALSFVAMGVGCNVALKIKLNDKDDSFFGIMVAIPYGRENYIKGTYYQKAKKIEDVWYDLDDNYSKHTDSKPFIIGAPKELAIKAEITITQYGPAACIIKLKMK